MAEYGGYDFKAKDKTLYECPICKKIIKQFTELPCSHATCRCCLEHWEQQRSEMLRKIGEGDPNVPTCITCNQVYDIKDKHYSGAFDRMIVNDLEVLCQLHEEGCQWFGTISDYQRHSDNECLFQSIHCRFNGCNEQFQRRFKTNHENSCSEREQNCDYCNNVIKVFNELHHHKNECSRFPTECTNQDCQQVLPRNEIEEHRQNECLQQNVPCIYSDIGCDVKIKRCHLERHDNEFNTTHTKLLFKEFQISKEQLLTTQHELKETKERLLATSKITEETQNELQKTKERLLSTTKTAEKTKNELRITEGELDRVKEESRRREERCIARQQNLATASTIALLNAVDNFVDVVQLMRELVQPNPPQTTQRTYAEKIHRVCNEINEGQLFHINDNECFFKLRIQRNDQMFYIYHVDDVANLRKKRTEFSNEFVILRSVYWQSFYHLYVSIANCQCFIVNTKMCGENRLLKFGGNSLFGGNYSINWNLYKNENDEVIFYFKKKN